MIVNEILAQTQDNCMNGDNAAGWIDNKEVQLSQMATRKYLLSKMNIVA